MTGVWTPEHSLTEDEAQKLIASQFPFLKPVEIKLLGKGFDNTVFKVNKGYVFRFPRRSIAQDLLETENKLLPELVTKVTLPIPKPVFFGSPEGNYPWPFTGYVIVKGETLGTLTNEARDQSADKLATFLKELHAFPSELAKSLGVPYDSLNRLSIEKRKKKLLENLERIPPTLVFAERDQLLSYAKNLEPIKLDLTEILVHGDLHIRNLIVDHTGIVSGIIDWGDVHIGHPAVDLSIAYSFLSPAGRKKFFRIYGEVSEDTKTLSRFKAVYTSVLLLLYALDEKDYILAETAKASIAAALRKDMKE